MLYETTQADLDFMLNINNLDLINIVILFTMAINT